MITVAGQELMTRMASVALPPLGHLQTTAAWADWSQTPFVLDEDGWKIHLDTSLDANAGRIDVFIDVEHKRTFIHPDVWMMLQEHGPAMQQFVEEFVWQGAEGMSFLIPDAGVYGDAARRQAAREGSGSPFVKDRVVQLGEDARNLIITAVSLNALPSEAQQREFAVRYAQLQEQFAVTEAALARVRSLIDLACAALVDASTP